MPHEVLLVDNYDSFTWNLAHLIECCGARVEVVRNDQASVAEVFERAPSHVVISPGPGTPDRAGISCELVRQAISRIPVLGVCLGHQAIAVAFGGALRRVEPPIHGEASVVVHDGCGIFSGLASPLAVARYHSLVIREDVLPPDLIVTARCKADASLVMGIRHRAHPVFGVQFHPESFLTDSGKHVMTTFLEGHP